jgi:hypothetical protein
MVETNFLLPEEGTTKTQIPPIWVKIWAFTSPVPPLIVISNLKTGQNQLLEEVKFRLGRLHFVKKDVKN